MLGRRNSITSSTASALLVQNAPHSSVLFALLKGCLVEAPESQPLAGLLLRSSLLEARRGVLSVPRRGCKPPLALDMICSWRQITPCTSHAQAGRTGTLCHICKENTAC